MFISHMRELYMFTDSFQHLYHFKKCANFPSYSILIINKLVLMTVSRNLNSDISDFNLLLFEVEETRNQYNICYCALETLFRNTRKRCFNISRDRQPSSNDIEVASLPLVPYHEEPRRDHANMQRMYRIVA